MSNNIDKINNWVLQLSDNEKSILLKDLPHAVKVVERALQESTTETILSALLSPIVTNEDIENAKKKLLDIDNKFILLKNEREQAETELDALIIASGNKPKDNIDYGKIAMERMYALKAEKIIKERNSLKNKEVSTEKENVKVENLEEQPKKQQRRSKAQIG